ncbi:MAG: hypothetical protein IBX63_10785 [Coriobacteriia bacterium]|nr:hypothetical protein [Coriobacteriia bacterium]
MFGVQDSVIILAASVLLGIAATGLSASLSYYLTRKRQLEADERRLRQDHYLKYVRALSTNVATGGKSSAVAETARAYNELLLVATPAVVEAARRFSSHTAPTNPAPRSQEWFDEHGRLLGSLLVAMRGDLFGPEKRIGVELSHVEFQAGPGMGFAPQGPATDEPRVSGS